MVTQPAKPPTPDRPHWRDGDGRRTTVLAVLAAHAPATREQLLDQHADAVCRIVRAAAAARLGGDHVRARMLANQASRLCGELAGLWPAGSDEPLR
jgi:hypothetical protein